jgi:hypothetical protein
MYDLGCWSTEKKEPNILCEIFGFIYLQCMQVLLYPFVVLFDVVVEGGSH